MLQCIWRRFFAGAIVSIIHLPTTVGAQVNPATPSQSVRSAEVGVEEISRIWLTYKSNDPSRIVVNWWTDEPGDSEVQFWSQQDGRKTVHVEEMETIHHVEIPLARQDVTYSYRVRTGRQRSQDFAFQSCPTDELRLAIIADWHGKPDLSAIVRDDIALLLTAGDNVTNIYGQCGEGNRDCVSPFVELVASYPDLFQSTPIMPVLGNHDRQIRPRGDKPPPEPVYDIDATAYCRFFELPDDEWKWRFDFPEFDLRLVGLDLSHVSDVGTTYQTCHPLDGDSDQFRWYKKLMDDPLPFVVTIHNTSNGAIRHSNGWHAMINQGTCCITGYGYFAERAEVDGFPYYNTALNGKGDPYPDSQSTYFAQQNNYILMTVSQDRKMTVEIKNLDTGDVLDRQEYEANRPRSE